MHRIKGCLLLLLCAALLSGCASRAQGAPLPSPTAEREEDVDWPQTKLEMGESGVPMLDVYVVDEQQVRRMDIETYVQGVLAGEMKNDWPMEALKAQAILARTFVLKFVEEKESRYPGADISTDIEEAQAYSAADVNDRIRQAVAETRGEVLMHNGELPYAWFHAHSGGVTERAKTGLGWNEAEPSYTASVRGNEPENAKDQQALQDAASWEASFPYAEFEAALQSLGVTMEVDDGSRIQIGQHGESGRAATIEVNGRSVGAAELRIALGSTKMRSTLLTSLAAENGSVRMAGKGYGHGVGMSQWGAYGMAQAGEDAEDIVEHYFNDVDVEEIW